MPIQANIDNRKAAEALHQTIGSLLREEVPQLPSQESRLMFWRLMLESVRKNLPAEPSGTPTEPPEGSGTPEKQKQKKKPVLTTSTSYDDAMALIDEIEDLAGSICENGQDFASSVEEKATSIGESVERAGSATDGQLQALENMVEGLRAWFHD